MYAVLRGLVIQLNFKKISNIKLLFNNRVTWVGFDTLLHSFKTLMYVCVLC